MPGKYCLALDLIDDENLIREYEAHHQKVRPEILASIREAGIINMEIFRVANRMFMIMETDDSFDFVAKAAADQASEKVQEWEKFTWQYQQALPFAKPGEKWMLMEKIFELKEQ